VIPLLLLLFLAPAAAAPPAVGEPAPDFALPDADGVEHRLSELRGAPVVINFWASWCGPCLRELPRLEQARAAAGVPFVLVNLDRQRDPEGAVAAAWSPPALPTTWVLGPDGAVAEVHEGAVEDGDVDALVERLRALAKGSP
jgi:thiol-disulfide isomerase/thioredoxin